MPEKLLFPTLSFFVGHVVSRYCGYATSNPNSAAGRVVIKRVCDGCQRTGI